MRKIIRVFVLSLVSILCFCSFFGCVDYGYNFHYRVDGGNGVLEIEKAAGFQPTKHLCKESGCELDCPENSYYFQMGGNKRGSNTLTFVAIPDVGYQVQEWSFNGEVVKGNKTNSYIAIVSHKEKYNAVITVKFEPIE